MNPELRLFVWRNALGAMQMRYRQGPQLPSLSEARRLVKKSMGPLARIWNTDGRFTLGYDLRPGRTVLARGPTVHACLISFLGTLIPAPDAQANQEPAAQGDATPDRQQGPENVEQHANP